MWTPHEIREIEDINNISFQVYPPEFILAEKLETIIRFGTGNTRVKDFIDLDILIKSGWIILRKSRLLFLDQNW